MDDTAAIKKFNHIYSGIKTPGLMLFMKLTPGQEIKLQHLISNLVFESDPVFTAILMTLIISDSLSICLAWQKMIDSKKCKPI